MPLVAPAMAVGLVALVAGVARRARRPAARRHPGGARMGGPADHGRRSSRSRAALPFASVTLEPPLDHGRGRRGVRDRSRPGRGGDGPASVARSGSTGADAARAPWLGRDARERRAVEPPGGQPTGATIGLVVASPSPAPSSRPSDGVARVTVLDVGQGDAILVEGVARRRLLVDGGPDPDRLLVALDRRVPPWDRRIDAVILSPPARGSRRRAGHAAGSLSRRRVFEPGMRGPDPATRRGSSGSARGAPVRVRSRGRRSPAVDEIALRRAVADRGARARASHLTAGPAINNISIVSRRVGDASDSC